jgi:predicted dehydrogenase
MRFMVIGTGFGETHLGWLAETPGARVEVLGYRRDRRRALDLAGRFGVPEVTADPQAWLGKVDALAVVTPPDTHEPHIEAGLAAGLLVVTDKPLAADLATAARLAGDARARQGRAAVVFQWRTHPALRRLRDVCASGRLGAVVRIDLEFHHDFLSGPSTRWPWRHQRAAAGAGALGDQGVHLFDLLGWLTPGPWSVSAGTASIVWPRRRSGQDLVACETEDVAEVLLRRPGTVTEAHARVLVSRVSTGFRELRARVQGTVGGAEVRADPEDGSARLRIFGAEPSRHEYGPTSMNPYTEVLTEPASPAIAGFAAGHAAQALLEQALSTIQKSSFQKSSLPTKEFT